jgi:hypothetical protein
LTSIAQIIIGPSYPSSPVSLRHGTPRSRSRLGQANRQGLMAHRKRARPTSRPRAVRERLPVEE